MINAQRLLQELKKLLTVLEADIRERLDESPKLDSQLQIEWQAARAAKRTAGAYLDWREENITQSAAHWILACVFLRFLEDNAYLSRAYLTSSDPESRAAARDDYERYFRANPNHSDLEYLLHVFRDISRLPGLEGLYDEQHNPLFRLPLSGDGGMALLAFWRKVDPDSGLLIHDFTDPKRETRFLGNLYQDLSESAKKRYALLQTPEFVEEFILARTLTPAIDTFGYKAVRLIDPACGSGHFLLGAFRRLFDLWARKEPARNAPDLAQQALNGVYGVDINPFAVEIARFRLLVAALEASDIRNLADAPDFRIHLAIGDSLLHGPRFGLRGTEGMFENKESYEATGLAHAYRTEDPLELQHILGQQYHVVVGNPPYITPKDAALRAAYRKRYISCHMKYSLGAPFTERLFELAMPAEDTSPAGYVGMITANSFMKREFGKKLVEEFLPTVDLTHIIDTSGAYIPGHGTPTVILFGRHRGPMSESVRTVMGIRGEPSTPEDPAHGQVWTAIVAQVDEVGSESDFVSVADTSRVSFAKHPWSVAGGGAADLKKTIEAAATNLLKDQIAVRRSIAFVGDREITRETLELGFASFPGQDEVFIRPKMAFLRRKVVGDVVRKVVTGDVVRDWTAVVNEAAFVPYDGNGSLLWLDAETAWAMDMWPFRSTLSKTISFGGATKEQLGQHWWAWYRWIKERYATPLTLTFGEVATHNHFVLDRGGKVFNRTAPVIKLKEGATEAEHLGLLGLLNSSVACFWLKQMCHNKGSTVDEKGARQRTMPFEDFYAFNSTKVAQFPVVEPKPVELAKRLDTLAAELQLCQPAVVVAEQVPTRAVLDDAKHRFENTLGDMIALQEELDWTCYTLYGITAEAAT